MVAEQIHRDHQREQHLRVLVVEGDPAERARLQSALTDGYSLRFANGISDALIMLQQELPDLLVSEVDLPDGSGLSLCEHVRGQLRTADLPIMLLTQRGSITDKVAGFQVGADDYVVKPPDNRLFPGRLRLLFRIKRLQHHPRPASA